MQEAPITISAGMLNHRNVIDYEQSEERTPNLDNTAFKAIEEEAEVVQDAINESSDLNRVVSEILKNRKCDPDDAMSKKRRQRLTYE